MEEADSSHITFHFEDNEDNETVPMQPVFNEQEAKRFIPNNQAHGNFAYHNVRKPPFVTAVIFWRTLKMFRQLDANRIGSVHIDLLIPNLQVTYYEDLNDQRSLNVIQEECLRAPSQTGQDTVSVEFFLEILDHVCQNYEDQSKYLQSHTEQANLDRLATTRQTDEEMAVEVRQFHDQGCCTRCINDCILKKEHDKAKQIKSSFFDFSRIEARFGASVTSYFYFAQSIFFFNLTISLVFLIILIPGLLNYDWSHSKPGYENNTYYGLAFGSGMENSWLFYGYYKAYYFGGNYNMQISYVIVLIVMFIASLVVILRYMNTSSSSLDELDRFKVCHEVFAGLDFSVRDRVAINLMQEQTFRNLRELAQEAEEELKVAKKEEHIGGYGSYARRYFGYFMTLLLIGGSCAIVALMIIYEKTVISPALAEKKTIARYAELIVPASVSFFRIISPMLIFAIVAFEKYELADDRFIHTFSRLFATRMFYVLVILFQTMYTSSSDQMVDNSSLSSSSSLAIDPIFICKETQVGVFYYSIIFLDIFIDTGVSWGAPLMKKIARRCFRLGTVDEFAHSYSVSDKFKDEFPIPVNIINIMYQQGLIWSGMPYCPALPLLGSLSLFIVIQVKRIQVLFLCRPSLVPMGVSRQEGYYRSLLIVTLIIAMVPFSFFLRTPVKCGPHYDASGVLASPLDTMWAYVDTLPGWVSMLVTYLQNVVVLWVFLIILIMYSTFLRKNIVSAEDELKYVRERVKLEMRDLQEIIKKEKIVLDDMQEQGRYQYKLWMTSEDMVYFAHKYSGLFTANYFDDLYELTKLTNKEVGELLSGWTDSDGLRIESEHLKFFQKKLSEKRRELI